MKQPLDRFYLSWNDRRKTRWWNEARQRAEDAPEAVKGILSLGPDEFTNVTADDLDAFATWVEQAGLGDPPLGIMDRESEAWRANADGFSRNFDRAYLGETTGLKALHVVLTEREAALVVTYDDERGGWFCRIDDSEWGQVDDTPYGAVKAFVLQMLDDLIDGPGGEKEGA